MMFRIGDRVQGTSKPAYARTTGRSGTVTYVGDGVILSGVEVRSISVVWDDSGQVGCPYAHEIEHVPALTPEGACLLCANEMVMRERKLRWQLANAVCVIELMLNECSVPCTANTYSDIKCEIVHLSPELAGRAYDVFKDYP